MATPCSDSTNRYEPAPRKHIPIIPPRPRTVPRRRKPPFDGVEAAALTSKSSDVQTLLDEALSALRREQAESRLLKAMLEEARASEMNTRSIADGMRRQMLAVPVLVEPVVAARPQALDSTSHSPHSAPSSSKEPTTPIWLREAASTLGSLAPPETQPPSTPRGQVDGGGGARTEGGCSEISIEYIRVWLVSYLGQVYGGAARESHAALARVLVSMLQLPVREAAHLNALISGDQGFVALPRVAPRPAAAAPQEEEPSMWKLITCSGPAALSAAGGGRALVEEERRMVALSGSKWW